MVSRTAETSQRHQLRGRQPQLRERELGLTLMELLTVVAILTVIFGVSVAVYRKVGVTYSLPASASQTSSVVRAARNLSVSAGIPSKVFVNCQEDRHSIAAFGFKLVANWHFEDVEDEVEDGTLLSRDRAMLGGRRDKALVQGDVYVAPGKIGRGLYFGDGGAVAADHVPRFHSPVGVSLEAWVQFDPLDLNSDALYAVVSKPGSYELGVTGDGAVYMSLWGAEEAGGNADGEYFAHSEPGLVPFNRWTHLRGSYDGLELTIEVDGVAVEWFPAEYELVHPDEWPAPPSRIPGPDSYLSVSRADRVFMGTIDEVKVRIALEPRVFELPSGVFFLGDSQTIRFDSRGSLDPLHHREPVVIRLSSNLNDDESEDDSEGLTAVAQPAEDEATADGEVVDEEVGDPLAGLARFIEEEAARRAAEEEEAPEGEEVPEANPMESWKKMGNEAQDVLQIIVDLTGTIRG